MTMRRAPIVLSATALGLAATLGFNARHAETATPTATTAITAATSSSSASSSSSGTTSAASTSAKTVTGDAVATQYGPVQLKVTISNGKITKVEAVQLPQNDPKSSQISSYAEPLLQQSALRKQSANVDAVSGATFTSEGYRTALQSALDQAGFATSSSAATA